MQQVWLEKEQIKTIVSNKNKGVDALHMTQTWRENGIGCGVAIMEILKVER